jgi:hypothetical protein
LSESLRDRHRKLSYTQVELSFPFPKAQFHESHVPGAVREISNSLRDLQTTPFHPKTCTPFLPLKPIIHILEYLAFYLYSIPTIALLNVIVAFQILGPDNVESRTCTGVFLRNFYLLSIKIKLLFRHDKLSTLNDRFCAYTETSHMA